MIVEPVGVVTIVIGIMCVAFGPQFCIFALMVSTLLGAASAALLSSFGGTNIPVAHVLLAFLFLGLARRPNLAGKGFAVIAPGRPGFWLFLTVAYGGLASFLLPRLFAGVTSVYALGQSEAGVTTVLQVPLGPVSGNVTQCLYMAADLGCFALFSAYGTTATGVNAFAKAGLTCAFANLLFAVLDVLTYVTNTSEALSFIRNASYRMLADVELEGLKRIVGSFPEASSFAYATLGLFAFSFNLMLLGVHARASGAAALGSILALLAGTSTSGYVGLGIFLAVQYTTCVAALARGSATRNAFIFVLVAPILVATICLGVYMHSESRQFVQVFADTTLFNKLESDSGLERASWNAQALRAFWETFGLGAGVGSVRAASWLVAVPASMGVLGLLTYGLFVLAILRSRVAHHSDGAAVRYAAKMCCVAQLVGASITGASVDFGLMFFAMAAVACSSGGACPASTTWDRSPLQHGSRRSREQPVLNTASSAARRQPS